MSEDSKDFDPGTILRETVTKYPDMAIAVAAIKVLTGVIQRSKATTMMELEIELKAATDLLKEGANRSISLTAGCDLFGRYVTRTSYDIPDFYQCKASLIERGREFSTMSSASRQTIASLMYRFIGDDKLILVHGFSRVVISALVEAAKRGKYFRVITTESRQDSAGYDIAAELAKENIPVTVILDSAVGYYADTIDFVLLGADGVVENGGIINRIGTYQLAMVAKLMKCPVYVAAESYKFARLYPLNQRDVPISTLPTKDTFVPENHDVLKHNNVTYNNPTCDYTPPEYITLLFTDLGILTPSAVSDELIKLYL